MTVRVATGIDLPADSAGGSMILLEDIYCGRDTTFEPQVFTLPGRDAPNPPVTWLDVQRPETLDGIGFWTYVDELAEEIGASLRRQDVDVLHLQHLAFASAPALLRALPTHPSIALCHGTDLLAAERHPTQRRVLAEIVARAARVVVPTPTLADRLERLAPGDVRKRIVDIPWGVPVELLSSWRRRRPAPTGGPLRVLYAGRLSPEKGFATIVAAMAHARNATLAVAAPEHEFIRLYGQLGRDAPPMTYLGWLDRRQLWDRFCTHDCLVVPSTSLEAFGLVAVEAQACELPVLYQPVPGLADTLADSAIALDMRDPRHLAATFDDLAADRSTLDDLRQSGKRNARRYPISRTVAELAALSRECMVANVPPRSNLAP